MKCKETYRLIDYFDVWGNAKDGWEVNNLCEVENEIFIDDSASNKEIVEFLKEIKYFSDDVTEDMLDIEGDDFYIEFYQKIDGMPLGRLERMVA